MSKTMRAFLCVLMSAVMLLTMNLCGFTAVSASGTSVQPRYSYTDYAKASLTISSAGSARCVTEINGASSATKIHVEMKLQKYTALWWSNQQTWETTVNDSYAALSKTKTVGNGKYRVKVIATVYSGSNSEKVEVISATKTYSS